MTQRKSIFKLTLSEPLSEEPLEAPVPVPPVTPKPVAEMSQEELRQALLGIEVELFKMSFRESESDASITARYLSRYEDPEYKLMEQRWKEFTGRDWLDELS